MTQGTLLQGLQGNYTAINTQRLGKQESFYPQLQLIGQGFQNDSLRTIAKI